MKTRAMVVGLGPIGCAVARQLFERRGFALVAAVDTDPAKEGRDLAEITGLAGPTGVRVGADLDTALRRARPQVAVLCTGSSLRQARPLIESVLARRVAIVSTTEELAYPWRTNATLARRIDRAARGARVAVVGTGVNPGFAMDALPIMLSAACERVDSIRVDRVQDARSRRIPFQRKIGAGLAPARFLEEVRAGRVRHVGLAESVGMIADAMGWKLDRILDDVRPWIAESAVEGGYARIEPGEVAGLIQDGIGYRGPAPVIVLRLEAYLGAPESFDRVTIEGSPRLCVTAAGGYHGDVVTASIAVNSIPCVLEARPGLHTMRTLALPSFAGDGGGSGGNRRRH
jgi:4-hydroxy-tetrahydrodipicolinate reductase